MLAATTGAIHSCFKQQVGSRLARGALATAYGRADLQPLPSVGSARPSGHRELSVTIVNASALIVRSALGFEVLVDGNPAPMWFSARQLSSLPRPILPKFPILARACLSCQVLTSPLCVYGTRFNTVLSCLQAPIVRTDGGHTITLSLANVTAVGNVTALRYLWSNTPCSGDILRCPVYVPAPRLGSLTGEDDAVPLGPAIVPVMQGPAPQQSAA